MSETIDEKAKAFAEQQTTLSDSQKYDKLEKNVLRLIREIGLMKNDNLLVAQHLKAYSEKYKELFLEMDRNQRSFENVNDDVIQAIAKKIDSQTDSGYKSLIKQLLESDNEAQANALKPQQQKQNLDNEKSKKKSNGQFYFNIVISLVCIALAFFTLLK